MTIRRITLNRLGHLLNLDPPEAGLPEALGLVRHRIGASADGYVELQRGGHHFDGSWLPAGLEHQIRNHLQQAGCHVNAVHQYGAWRPMPEPVSLGRAGLDMVHQLVRRAPRGLIHAAAESLFPQIIAGIATVFPQARIAVTGGSRDRLETLGRSLPADVPATLLDGSGQGGDARIVVGTFYDLAEPGVDVWSRDILLVYPAGHVCHERALPLLQTPDQRFRLFGLAVAGKRLSEADERLRQAWYGPAGVHLQSKSSFRRPVVVRRYKTRRGKVPQLSGRMPAVELKRQGIWDNPQRDLLIARRALQFAAADWNELHLDPQQLGRSTDTPPPRVAVLAEDPLHAVSLAEQMPGWRVAPVPLSEFGGELPEELAAAGDRLLGDSEQEADRAVLTFATCTPQRLGRLDVLLRADGGSGIPHCLRESVIRNTMCGPFLLVDFVDEHHRQLQKWSRRRQQQYRQRGWWSLDTGGTP